MKRFHRGLTSLDTLIIFVAILITVAVAAIILINTGGALQQRALNQGSEGRKSVTSGVEVINVIGLDASPDDPYGTPHKLEYLYIMVRLLPGTNSVPLNSTLILLQLEPQYEQTVSFNGTCGSECTSSSAEHFMVFYIQEGNYHENGYVNIGDVAKLSIRLGQPLGEDKSADISIFPQHGPRTIVKFETPQNMVSQMQTLWPVA